MARVACEVHLRRRLRRSEKRGLSDDAVRRLTAFFVSCLFMMLIFDINI